MEKLNVLVVDDNAAHGEGLAELLDLNGFAALHATTGTAALEIAATHSLDAVLLDIHLPDMTGYDVCQKIRSNPAMEQVAVIFHTGSEPIHQREHGGDAFMTYPVVFSELFAVIQGCVSRRRAKKAVNETPSEDAASIV